MLPLKSLPQRAVAKGLRAARAQRRERSRPVQTNSMKNSPEVCILRKG
jgi:hypothetical protein